MDSLTWKMSSVADRCARQRDAAESTSLAACEGEPVRYIPTTLRVMRGEHVSLDALHELWYSPH